jgi:TRC40/GET3/ArsA family transport-energizing ATPase
MEVRFEAEAVLDELVRAAADFDEHVLRAGSFVIATRAGRVVQAETDRLAAELEQRGAHISATVTDRATSSSDQLFFAPRLSPATGCAALRDWAARVSQQPPPAAAAPRRASRGDAVDRIAGTPARLIWVAGKGGVGKSTCAAAIATLLAESRNVRVVSTDPAGSLGEVFGCPTGAEGTRVQDALLARQIDASDQLERMRRDYRASVERVFAALGLETAAQLDRRVVETLFDFAPPGIDEIIALVEIMEHADEYDVTIIDSAPTGHFLRLLELPEIALQWVHALLRMLLKYRAVASLDALGEDLLAFSKRLHQLKLDLSARETTAVYLVTQAEGMVTAQTRRLCDALERAHIPVAAIILNRADAGHAHAMRSAYPAYPMLRAPDTGDEIVGAVALRNFLSQWEIVGE